MNWFLLQKIGFLVFLLLTIYYTFKKEYEKLLILYFFGLTFGSWFYFLVTIWQPIKIVNIGMIFCLLFHREQRLSLPPPIRHMIFLLLIMLFYSDLIALLLPGKLQVPFNPTSRLIIQNYTYISGIGLLLFGTILKPGFLHRIYPKYCLAIEIAIIIGLIHYFCLLFNIPFSPILRQDGSVNDADSVLAMFGDDIVKRVYGFSGEPKSLGFAIVPYLLISFISFSRGLIRKSRHYHIILFFLGIFVLIQTYSSSALMQFALALIPISLFFRIKISPKVILLCLFSLIIWSGFTFNESFEVNDVNSKSFFEKMQERTFGRAEEELENDRQETVIFNYYKSDKLIHQIFGWGVAQYTFHVPNQTIGNALIPVQSGLVLTLIDFGIIGILVLGLYGLILLGLLIYSFRKKNIYSTCFSIGAFASFLGSLMFGSLITSFIYFMLASYSSMDKSLFNSKK